VCDPRDVSLPFFPIIPTATTSLSPLSLHDALPISARHWASPLWHWRAGWLCAARSSAATWIARAPCLLPGNAIRAFRAVHSDRAGAAQSRSCAAHRQEWNHFRACHGFAPWPHFRALRAHRPHADEPLVPRAPYGVDARALPPRAFSSRPRLARLPARRLPRNCPPAPLPVLVPAPG